MRTRLLAVLACGLLAACGPKSTPAPATPAPATTTPAEPPASTQTISDADLEAIMRETVAMFTAVSDAVSAAGGDCAKVATGIEQAAGEHAELLQRAHALDEDPSATDRAEKWMGAHEAELKPVFERLFAGLEPCKDDPAVQAAMEKMSGG